MRCKAIRKAVEKYNAAALALDPPKPTLDWAKVSHYSFIEEFNILNDTSGDIVHKDWASPVGRATLKQWRRILRAKEEVLRCNLEARRQHTSIRDEELLFDAVLDDFKKRSDPWYGALLEYCQRRRSVNAYIMVWLQRMYSLKGFSGDRNPGRRTGGFADHPVVVASTKAAEHHVSDTDINLMMETREVELETAGGPELDDGDDEAEAGIGGLIDFISDLTL